MSSDTDPNNQLTDLEIKDAQVIFHTREPRNLSAAFRPARPHSWVSSQAAIASAGKPPSRYRSPGDRFSRSVGRRRNAQKGDFRRST